MHYIKELAYLEPFSMKVVFFYVTGFDHYRLWMCLIRETDAFHFKFSL